MIQRLKDELKDQDAKFVKRLALKDEQIERVRQEKKDVDELDDIEYQCGSRINELEDQLKTATNENKALKKQLKKCNDTKEALEMERKKNNKELQMAGNKIKELEKWKESNEVNQGTNERNKRKNEMGVFHLSPANKMKIERST